MICNIDIFKTSMIHNTSYVYFFYLIYVIVATLNFVYGEIESNLFMYSYELLAFSNIALMFLYTLAFKSYTTVG